MARPSQKLCSPSPMMTIHATAVMDSGTSWLWPWPCSVLRWLTTKLCFLSDEWDSTAWIQFNYLITGTDINIQFLIQLFSTYINGDPLTVLKLLHFWLNVSFKQSMLFTYPQLFPLSLNKHAQEVSKLKILTWWIHIFIDLTLWTDFAYSVFWLL